MKKLTALLLLAALLLALTGCAKEELPVPQKAQMKSICELATMECYYHNVAKYKQEDAEKFLMFAKDKHFWIEYAGQVKIGIDVSLLDIDVTGQTVTITLPPAKVLGCKVDETTLNESSFIVAKGSADITAEDQTAAFRHAQQDMLSAAESDTILLFNARERARKLLEDYVNNISAATGVEYDIQWKDAASPAAPEATAAPAA